MGPYTPEKLQQKRSSQFLNQQVTVNLPTSSPPFATPFYPKTPQKVTLSFKAQSRWACVASPSLKPTPPLPFSPAPFPKLENPSAEPTAPSPSPFSSPLLFLTKPAPLTFHACQLSFPIPPLLPARDPSPPSSLALSPSLRLKFFIGSTAETRGCTSHHRQTA